MASSEQQEMKQADTPSKDVESISSFIMTSATPSNDDSSPTPRKQIDATEPKSTSNYWLSPAAKARKSEYMKKYHARKKEELNNTLQYLKEHTLQPRIITLYNMQGNHSSRRLLNDIDYERFIDDMLATLVDAQLLRNYDIQDGV